VAGNRRLAAAHRTTAAVHRLVGAVVGRPLVGRLAVDRLAVGRLAACGIAACTTVAAAGRVGAAARRVDSCMVGRRSRPSAGWLAVSLTESSCFSRRSSIRRVGCGVFGVSAELDLNASRGSVEASLQARPT
jgi:hypothetical protein